MNKNQHKFAKGDLVRFAPISKARIDVDGLGMVVGFDEDKDPIIWWFKAEKRWSEFNRDVVKA